MGAMPQASPLGRQFKGRVLDILCHIYSGVCRIPLHPSSSGFIALIF
jgi:hypothetical protein